MSTEKNGKKKQRTLKLSKETLRNLTVAELMNVKGGKKGTSTQHCGSEQDDGEPCPCPTRVLQM